VSINLEAFVSCTCIVMVTLSRESFTTMLTRADNAVKYQSLWSRQCPHILFQNWQLGWMSWRVTQNWVAFYFL